MTAADAAATAPVESSAASAPAGRPAGARRPRRRRLVLWVSLSIAAVLAVLIAVLASSGPAGDKASSPLIGKLAPAISGNSLEGGGAVSLSQFSGKWVLVNFAASWCIPCHEEMPQLKLFAQQHQSPSTAVILTVADDESDVGSLRAYLRSAGATWPSVDDGQAVVDYGVGQIPESYLVDPSGRVVAKYFGGVVAATLDAFIAKASEP